MTFYDLYGSKEKLKRLIHRTYRTGISIVVRIRIVLKIFRYAIVDHLTHFIIYNTVYIYNTYENITVCVYCMRNGMDIHILAQKLSMNA